MHGWILLEIMKHITAVLPVAVQWGVIAVVHPLAMDNADVYVLQVIQRVFDVPNFTSTKYNIVKNSDAMRAVH